MLGEEQAAQSSSYEPVLPQSIVNKNPKRYRPPLLDFAFGDIGIENRSLNLMHTWFLPGFSHSL